MHRIFDILPKSATPRLYHEDAVAWGILWSTDGEATVYWRKSGECVTYPNMAFLQQALAEYRVAWTGEEKRWQYAEIASVIERRITYALADRGGVADMRRQDGKGGFLLVDGGGGHWFDFIGVMIPADRPDVTAAVMEALRATGFLQDAPA